MEPNLQETLNPDQDDMQKLFQHLSIRNSSEFCDDDGNLQRGDQGLHNHVDDDDEEKDEEEEEEFSFMSAGADTSPVAAEDAFMDGQIKQIFPLFNRDLLLSSHDLPMKPHVQRVFVEMTERENYQMTSSTSGNDEISGPYCDWSNRKAVEVEAEACKKSNSTGFSMIWRFKDFIGRSNSDGRDAFVFLNNSHPPPFPEEHPTTAAVAVKEDKVEVERKKATVNVSGKVKKATKHKTASLSAHEVYLKRKAKDEERRRSPYLPYRPELMGFFTNVHGVLNKNVHPY